MALGALASRPTHTPLKNGMARKVVLGGNAPPNVGTPEGGWLWWRGLGWVECREGAALSVLIMI